MTDEIKPTDKIQLQSLIAFAEALGYRFVNWPLENKYFYSVDKKNKSRSNISVTTMILLHNGNYLDWHGRRFRSPFNFDTYSFTKARASRIVQTVHLQHNKKTNSINCSSHWVKFVDPHYAYLFLGVLP